MSTNPVNPTEAAASRVLSLAHSPDPDDAFMFWALAKNLVDAEGLRFEHILQDIQTLNERALRGELDITAVSAHAYVYLADQYALLPCGASMGDGYGPLVVARNPMTLDELRTVVIAVPGKLTSAFLALQLCIGRFEFRVMPFEAILDAVVGGQADAGLLIHEGQLTYGDAGLHCVVDLGVWWKERTGGLPLPLGNNAVKRSLGRPLMSKIARVLRRSIEAGLANRRPALEHSLQWGRGLEIPTADTFVGMYVNDLTLDLGDRGREGLRRFLAEARQHGFIPRDVNVDFVEYE